MPYRVKSWPEVTGSAVASPDSQGILMALASKWVPSASGGVLMGGGSSAQFEFSSSDPPQFLEARQDGLMLIGSVLLNLLSVILNPLGGGAAFLDTAGKGDCLSGIVATGTSDKLDAATAAALFKTTLTCFGTTAAAASFPVRLALALIGTVPALFAGVAIGLVNELTGQGTERINVESNVAPWTITADGIGPFKVGETTWSDVKEMPGFNAVLDDWSTYRCVSGGWFDGGTIYDGVSVLAGAPSATGPYPLDSIALGSYFRTGVAATVPATTAEGIGLGSSQAEVEAAYPNVQPVPHRLAQDLSLYRVENGAGRAIQIGVEGSVVTNVSVGLTGAVYATEGCV
jgi:hypothetical protein